MLKLISENYTIHYQSSVDPTQLISHRTSTVFEPAGEYLAVGFCSPLSNELFPIALVKELIAQNFGIILFCDEIPKNYIHSPHVVYVTSEWAWFSHTALVDYNKASCTFGADKCTQTMAHKFMLLNHLKCDLLDPITTTYGKIKEIVDRCNPILRLSDKEEKTLLFDTVSFCLVKGTKILMDNGLSKTIENIKVGDKVVGFPEIGRKHNYVSTEVTKLFEHQADVIKITGEGGFEIIGTPEHPVQCYQKNNGFYWTTLNNLCRGKIKSKICVEYNIELEQNRWFKRGQLVGLILGDGWMGEENIDFYNKNIILLDKYIELVRELCPTYIARDDYKKNGIITLRCYRKRFRQYIKALYNKLSSKEAPKDFLRGFLSGFISAEGSIMYHKNQVEITQSSLTNLDIVMSALTSCGFKFSKLYYHHKQGDLQIFPNRSKPYIIKDCYKLHINDKFKVMTDLQPLSKIKWNTVPANRKVISIVKKEYLGKQTVYNFETHTHTYIANGIRSHNCPDRGLGDMVMTLIPLKHMHEQGWKIDYLVRPQGAHILKGIPWINKVYASMHEITVRREGYASKDYPNPADYKWHFTLARNLEDYKLPRNLKCRIDSIAELLHINPIDIKDFSPNLYLSEEELAFGKLYREAGRPNLVLGIISTGSTSRSYPKQLLDPLIKLLTKYFHVILVDQHPILAEDTAHFTNLTGKINVRQWMSIVANSDINLCTDTGLYWIGLGFNKPAVVLFTTMQPELRIKYHTDLIYALNPDLPCKPCYDRQMVRDKEAWTNCRQAVAYSGYAPCAQLFNPQMVFKAVKEFARKRRII